MMEILTNNWHIILIAVLGLAEVIVRLTPTKKDDSIFNFIKKIVDALIPNKKKDGNKH